jgi:predicted SAM-dependent methyltransferase
MKIHVGCGRRDFGKGWVHVDGAEYSHISFHDIFLSDFNDNSADVIYSAHLIEYFDRDQVKELLKAWHWVLKPFGTLRIAVPDFRNMAKLYVHGHCTLSQILGPLYGKMPLNEGTIYHRTVYDFESLKSTLEECGFKYVQKYDWRKTEHAAIDDCSQAYIPHMDKEDGTLISLNIECVK